MKIRFTVTLTDRTVRGFKANGQSTAQEIIAVLKEPVQDVLDAMSKIGDVEDR